MKHTKRTLSRILLVALFLGSTIFGLWPQSLYAQSEKCDALVIDGANVFGTKTGLVEKEAQDLVRLGADVRVRTVKSFTPDANEDQYEARLRRECAFWRDDAGQRKNNLIVLLLSTGERRTAIYFGSAWDQALKTNDNYIKVQTQKMNPKFPAGQFAEGFIAGLEEIERLINLQLNPPPPTAVPVQPAQPVVVIVPTPQPAAPPSPPPDFSGLGQALIVLVVVLALAGAGWFAYSFIGQYQTEQEKRRVAQQQAKMNKQAAAERITGWEKLFDEVKLNVELLATQISTTEVKPLHDALVKAQNLMDQGVQQFQDADNSAGNPDRPNLSVREYARIEAAYTRALTTLQAAEMGLTDIKRKADDLQKLVDTSPKAVEAARAAIDLAQKRVAAVARSGFKANVAESMIERAQGLLTAARTSLGQKGFVEAQERAMQCQTAAGNAIKMAEDLPQQKQETDRAIQALKARLEGVQRAIIAGKALFDKISATYAPTSWESIRGNGTEATNRVNWSLKALETAQQNATMDVQDWQKAGNAIKQANEWLDQAESMMRSITALKVNLEAAQRDATTEVTAAQTDVDKAWAYINRYDPDIRESLEDDLRQVEKSLALAQKELGKDKPDFLMVVKLARQANGTADRILVEARGEREAAERQRQLAATCLSDAQRAVSQAEEYIEDHKTDIGQTAKSNLGSAQDYLHQAEATANLQAKIDLSERAKSKADSAYSQAKSDVEEAEEARRPKYSYRYAGYGSPSPTPQKHHYGGGGYRHDDDDRGGGGGGTSWSSGRGGGGGGTGW